MQVQMQSRRVIAPSNVALTLWFAKLLSGYKMPFPDGFGQAACRGGSRIGRKDVAPRGVPRQNSIRAKNGLDFELGGHSEKDFRLVEGEFGDHGPPRGRRQLDGEGSAGTPLSQSFFNFKIRYPLSLLRQPGRSDDTSLRALASL